jgi:predicted O-methyltransferase YrrM
MMQWNKIYIQITAYIEYLFKATSRKGHGIHSPFTFDFVVLVLNDKTGYKAYNTIEKYRKFLLADHIKIHVNDFGAGSRASVSGIRSVAVIARNTSVNRKFGRLLFRLCHHYKPDLIIELGTSLGIGTSCLAHGNPQAKVITVEADQKIARLAMEGFTAQGLTNIQSVVALFDEILPALLPSSPGKTLVFIDGNHNRPAVLKYAEFFLSKLPDGSIIIVDDINWSSDMQQAWKDLQENKKIAVTVDLFRLGIVFIKRDFFKENYTIRF